MKIGEKIKFLRTVQGLSQSQLCERVGTKPPYLARYEAGTNEPKRDMIRRLGLALNVSVEWLMFSSCIPFLLRAWAPFNAAKSTRQENNVVAGIKDLLPKFLSEIVLYVLMRFSNNSTAHYVLSYQIFDSQKNPSGDFSVLVLLIPVRFTNIIDDELAKIKIRELKDYHFRDDMLIQTELDEECESLLSHYLSELNEIMHGMIDPNKYLSDWIRSENSSVKSCSWQIETNLQFLLDSEVSKAEALDIFKKFIADSQHLLPKGLHITLRD